MTKVKQNQPKILILSLPRTGSSALAHSLAMHPEIRVLGEPFHPNNEGNFIRLVHDIDSFNSAIDKIFAECNCIKHMMHHVPLEFHRDVLKRDDIRVVFTHRKNLLKKVVSQFISRQTKVWGQGEEWKSKVLSHDFEPVPLPRIKRQIKKQTSLEHEYRKALKKLRVDYFNVAYEDLYDEKVSVEERLKILEKIIDFVGYDTSPLFTEPMRSRVVSRLEPSMKVNSEDSYRLIPNINEIEKEFGSRKTGYLFR